MKDDDLKLLDYNHFKQSGLDEQIVKMRYDHHLLKLKNNLNGIIEQRNAIIENAKQLAKEAKQEKRKNITIQTDGDNKGKTILDIGNQESTTIDETPANAGTTFDFVTSVLIDETNESDDSKGLKDSIPKKKER